MPVTFEAAWRRAHLQCEVVPALLVRDWAQDAYRELGSRWGWSFLRKDGIITVQPSRSVALTLTQGSTTVTSAGLFVAGDVGRQLKVPAQSGAATGLPIYTIASFTSVNSIDLDQPYADVGGALTATIFDGYFICPTDFRRFLQIYDRYYLRVIPFWMSEDQIAVADPGRIISDLGPRFLIAADYATDTTHLGQVRYEYWPKPTAFRTYPYLYLRRIDTLSDASVLPGVLSERIDLLDAYVLFKAALYAGTPDKKNPLFSPAVAAQYKQQFEDKLQVLMLEDDNEYPQQAATIHWMRRVGAIAPTGTLLRQTDATINDYY